VSSVPFSFSEETRRDQRVPEATVSRKEIGMERVSMEYSAVIKNTGECWIGWIEEVSGVNCQERSRDELIETLRVTLREALEFNRQEALASAGGDFQEEKIAV
jgi:predicted RNase H-like HicB family nuclease